VHGLKYLGVCVALLLMAACSVDYHFDQLEKSYKINKTMLVELRDALVNVRRSSSIKGIVLAPAETPGRTTLNLSSGEEVLFDEAIVSRFKDQQNELRRIKEIGKDLGVEYANLDDSASLWITTRGGGH